VITIEPGSIVRGALGTTTANPAALVFEQGSRIDANGNPANPIIFTSNGTPGTRLKGDWGGVVFNGNGHRQRPRLHLHFGRPAVQLRRLRGRLQRGSSDLLPRRVRRPGLQPEQ
jgi:hypothetical protein